MVDISFPCDSLFIIYNYYATCTPINLWTSRALTPIVVTELANTMKYEGGGLI